MPKISLSITGRVTQDPAKTGIDRPLFLEFAEQIT
jgi:hypothetical protein